MLKRRKTSPAAASSSGSPPGAMAPAAASSSGGPPGAAVARGKSKMCVGDGVSNCIFGFTDPPSRSQARKGKPTCAWCGGDLDKSRDSNHARGIMRKKLELLTGEAKKEALRRAPWLADKAPAVSAPDSSQPDVAGVHPRGPTVSAASSLPSVAGSHAPRSLVAGKPLPTWKQRPGRENHQRHPAED